MADLLPSTPDPSAGDGGDPRVIGVDSDDAADLLAALQSETARDILAALYDEPATPSAIADAADTSIQNVRYHLEKLADADLVEVADTVYSEKGREMKVYAPSAKPLVVFAGGGDDAPGVEAALSRLLGALGILGLSSLLVERFFGGGVGGSVVDFQGQSGEFTTENDYQSSGDAGDDAAATTAADADDGAGPNSNASGTTAEEAPEEATVTEADGTVTEAAETTQEAGDATEVATEAARTTVEEGDAATTAAEATRTAADATTTTVEEFARSTTTVADGAGAATAGLPPGLVFFLGGALVLAALGIAWYARAR